MSKSAKPVKTPLTTDESAALLRLIAVIGEFEDYSMLIQKRAIDAGVRDKLDKARIDLLTSMQKIVQTLPSEKEKLLRAMLDNMRVEIQIPPRYDEKGTAISYVSRKDSRYVCVPSRPFNMVLSDFMNHNCMICDGEEEIKAKCPYRKALESLYLNKIKADETNGKCRFEGLYD